jgi:hypothetical protein
LEKIPRELISLVEIDCFNCPELAVIPIELVNLKNLRCVYSKVREIPKELINLETLDCSRSSLFNYDGIPKELVNLKIIDCSHTCIITIPLIKSLERITCYGCNNLTLVSTHLIYVPQWLKPTIETNYQTYRKKRCSLLVNTILEELIQRTWHPSRMIDWCWDEDEKLFMKEYISN